MHMNVSVRMSKYDFDAGIKIVRYVHSLIGLAGNTITKKDVDTQCEGMFSSDKKLTTEGSDLIKLHHDVLQLMTVLYHRYLSIRLINGNVLPNIDPFKNVIGHGLMLSLSIAKWRNSLNSQLQVYVGDKLLDPGFTTKPYHTCDGLVEKPGI